MEQSLTRVLLGVLIVLSARPAYAYRPFNSTDAAVAERGDVEIECGPVGWAVEADERFLVIPSIILNLGVAEGWEIVVEGRNFFLVRPDRMERRNTVRDTALSLKGIVRSGSLQDGSGPSVGVEVGLLLPGIGTDPGLGASFLAVVSQRWSAATVHANGALLITHEHSLGGIASGIVEGPSRWAVRPVAEIVLEQNDGRSVSGVIGGIWQVRDKLSLDAGWRLARADGANSREFRAGFTWAFPLGTSGAARPTVPFNVRQGRSRAS
jgi:hypothetical protein